MTLAATQGLAYLLRRSFDFAQDDSFGCQSGQLQCCIPDQLQRCHPNQLQHCHPDRSGGIS